MRPRPYLGASVLFRDLAQGYVDDQEVGAEPSVHMGRLIPAAGKVRIAAKADDFIVLAESAIQHLGDSVIGCYFFDDLPGGGWDVAQVAEPLASAFPRQWASGFVLRVQFSGCIFC